MRKEIKAAEYATKSTTAVTLLTKPTRREEKDRGVPLSPAQSAYV